MKCFVIAEAGVNHNGSLKLALELVDRAADCGADAVKFQTFTAEKLVTACAPTAEYQKRTGQSQQFSLLKALEMSREMHLRVKEHCVKSDIEFMSTPFDIDSVDFLIDLGVKRIKIPSGEITNFPLLTYLSRTNLPLILSTGMSTLEEVKQAVNVIGGTDLTLLHCVSSYPAAIDEVNLLAMRTLASECHLPVGYSDHTQCTLLPAFAVSMGATVIEKHITLDNQLPGPDHAASLNPKEFKQMVKNIRYAERCMGSPIKMPTPNECNMKKFSRRSIVLRYSLKKGGLLSQDNLDFLRPGTGIPPSEFLKVSGKVLKQDLEAGSVLEWKHFE